MNNKPAFSFVNYLKNKKKEQKKPETPREQLISWVKTILGAIVVVMFINGAAIASFVVPTGSMENTVMTGDFLFVNKFLYGPTTPQLIPFFNIPIPFYKFPGIKEPEKEDVIVFIYPGDRDQVEPTEFVYYLKRCVATAGDVLEISNKKLIVNGKEMELPENGQYDRNQPIYPGDKQRTFPPGLGYTRDNYGPIRIPKKGDVIELTPQNIRQWDVFITREGHEVTSTSSNVYIDNQIVTNYTVARDYCFALGDNRDNSLDSRYWGFVPYDNVVGSPMVVYWSWDTNLPISQLIDKIASIRFGRMGTIIR
ncbi:MAG: signal peptidase I [Candidatus Kapaibacterium sp.]|jgi:signal peptidase I|nr:signal peptidase I [Candidatus Kapabacteria bacterium]